MKQKLTQQRKEKEEMEEEKRRRGSACCKRLDVGKLDLDKPNHIKLDKPWFQSDSDLEAF